MPRTCAAECALGRTCPPVAHERRCKQRGWMAGSEASDKRRAPSPIPPPLPSQPRACFAVNNCCCLWRSARARCAQRLCAMAAPGPQTHAAGAGGAAAAAQAVPSWGSARSVDVFEKLEQIGEGTYGQVCRTGPRGVCSLAGEPLTAPRAALPTPARCTWPRAVRLAKSWR